MVIKTFIAPIPQDMYGSDCEKYKTAFGILDSDVKSHCGIKAHFYSVEDTFLAAIDGGTPRIIAIKRVVTFGDKN